LYREGNIGNVVGRNYETSITKQDALLILSNYIHVNEEQLDIGHPLISLLSNQSIRRLRHKIQTDNDYFQTIHQYLMQLCQKHQNLPSTHAETTPSSEYANNKDIQPENSRVSSNDSGVNNSEYSRANAKNSQKSWSSDSGNQTNKQSPNQTKETPQIKEPTKQTKGVQEPVVNDWDEKKKETERYVENKKKNNKPKQEEVVVLTPTTSFEVSSDAPTDSHGGDTKRTKVTHRTLQTLSISVTSEDGTVFTLVPSNTLVSSVTGDEEESQQDRMK